MNDSLRFQRVANYLFAMFMAGEINMAEAKAMAEAIGAGGEMLEVFENSCWTEQLR